MIATKYKSYRLDRFYISEQPDTHGCVIKTVFFNYVPVVQFNVERANERKLAAIELVVRCICNQKMAGKICGFHRNTVHKLGQTKALLGLEAVLRDERGASVPYKYVNEVRSHIKKLLRKYPDWSVLI